MHIMRLISLMMSFLLMTVMLSYCLEHTGRISEKQADVKCRAEGYRRGSTEYDTCLQEGIRPISKRAVELKDQAVKTRKMIDEMNENARKQFQYHK